MYLVHHIHDVTDKREEKKLLFGYNLLRPLLDLIIKSKLMNTQQFC